MSMFNFITSKGNPILSERIICIMESEMGLIEQLGGYEATKEYLKKNSHFINFDGLERFYDELLEYRREHNIFEDNDYIVSLHDHEPSHLYIVKNITENGYEYGNDWGWYRVLSNEGVGYNFRHTTGEEIEAGRRL